MLAPSLAGEHQWEQISIVFIVIISSLFIYFIHYCHKYCHLFLINILVVGQEWKDHII